MRIQYTHAINHIIIYHTPLAVFPINILEYNMGDSESEFAFGEGAEDAVVIKKRYGGR